MAIKAVIFDLDGTLLDTLGDLTASVNELLQRYHYPTYSTKQISAMVGFGSTKLLEKALPNEAKHLTDTLMDEFLTIYKSKTELTSLYPGIAELLDHLVKAKIKLAIFTNKPEGPMQQVLKEFLSSWPIELAIGQSKTSLRKPNPQGIFTICEHLALKPSETLYIGDSEVDIETGLNAQITTIGCSWGFRTKEQLIACGAPAIIDSPLELLKALEE